MNWTRPVAGLTASLLVCGAAAAQTPAAQPSPPAPPPYGIPVDGDQAQRALTAAEAEARQNHWTMSFAVVDQYGNLVMFKSMAGAAAITGPVSIRKAKTAAALRAPSKVLADMAAKGSPLAQAMPDLIPIEGGFPIVVGGRLIGAIGASGAASFQDAQAAARGAAAAQ